MRFHPTIYKRPSVYKSNVYKRYGVNAGGIGLYKLPYGSPQEWTKTNVPAGVQTLHDFGDGAGPVPAIPTDGGTDVSEILSMTAIKRVYQDTMSSDKSEILSIDSFKRLYQDTISSDKSEILSMEVQDA